MDDGWMRMTRPAYNYRIAFRLSTTLAKVQDLAAITLHAFDVFSKLSILFFHHPKIDSYLVRRILNKLFLRLLSANKDI